MGKWIAILLLMLNRQFEMRLIPCIIISILLSITPLELLSQFSQIHYSKRGYVKNLSAFTIADQKPEFRYDNIIHHRLENSINWGDSFRIQADLRNRLFKGWSQQNTPFYGKNLDTDPGFFDLNKTIIDTKSATLHTSIDRLQLSFLRESWEFHLGRQRINWGKTLVWNPNDLFNAYAYLDFDYEERPGTDAAYFSYNWGFASSLEAGYAFGHTLDESVIALMLRSNLSSYDIQITTGRYHRYYTLGSGWSGYILDAGFKGEISFFQKVKESTVGKEHILTAALGSDYMFSNSFYLSGEILYNGGWNSVAASNVLLVQPPDAENLFISKTAYFLNTSKAITPLTSINLGMIGSFDRPLFIFMPQVTHSLSENIDFLMLAQIFRGSALTALSDSNSFFFLRFKWSY